MLLKGMNLYIIINNSIRLLRSRTWTRIVLLARQGNKQTP